MKNERFNVNSLQKNKKDLETKSFCRDFLQNMITRGFTFILGMIDWNIYKTKIEKKSEVKLSKNNFSFLHNLPRLSSCVPTL